MKPKLTLLRSLATGLALAATTPAFAANDEAPPRTDYLSFAQGALPVAVLGGDAVKAGPSQAMRAIDGNPGGYLFASKAAADTRVEFVYRLPAMTTFDRFAVPNVLETPSPSQTFARRIEVLGSAQGPQGPFTPLARAELKTHATKGQVSELQMLERHPVRWVKLALTGGIDVQRDAMFYEFSEIIGNGEQEAVPLSEEFNGSWRGRGFKITLQQQGAVVSGCYAPNGELQGTVSGNILRARGVGLDDGVESLFILMPDRDGALTGVSSSNGAPFRSLGGDPVDAASGPRCARPQPADLGCGAVIHAIRFGYDSAELTAESDPVLDSLAHGLQGAGDIRVAIEGHTSSEGDAAYNQSLSERRAAAVVAALKQRGLTAQRLSAVGRGEVQPIASNDDEAGRSLNRRVEVVCSE
jgi:OOP family OmpA-OmpF porin